MKQIIMALALTAFAYTGAQAQYCKEKHVAKHVRTAHHTRQLNKSNNVAPLPAEQTAVTSCKLVPYDVCRISADRKSVSCYKSMDQDELKPLYPGEFTYYGATGSMPGEDEKPTIETVVIKEPKKADYCKRNSAGDATVCYLNNARLTRDADGFYHY